MSSGDRQEVFNPLERILSTDMNRAQAFAGCALSEMLRALLDTNYGSDDVLAGGAYLPNLTQGNPVVAEVIGGLVFVPNIGSVGALVTSGVVAMYDPDAAPSTDDSQYKLIEDPGTSLLALTANASGSIRIDVIEAARVQPDNVVETDSRDIFNTVTGLFTAATINKVTQGQLQYRIRVGTPGSGYAGTVQGWFPLAIASVPTGTTTWDTVTLWDVRPLIDDRIFNIQNLNQDLPRRTKLLYSSNLGTGAQHIVNGIAESTAVFRRVGGRLQRGSPGTDAQSVDFSDTANQEAGLSLAGVNPALIYYYLCTPFGLPRWARYTDPSAGVRVPRSPRGIPIVSLVPPIHVYGISTTLIVLPSVFGFNGGSTFGVCIGATTYDAGVLNNQVTSDGWQNPASPVAAVTGTLPHTTIAAGSNGVTLPAATIHVASTTGFAAAGGVFIVDGSEVTYTGVSGGNTFTGCAGGSATLTTGDVVAGIGGTLSIQENVHFPAGATRLRLSFAIVVTLAAGTAAGNMSLLPLLNLAEVGNTFKQFAFADLPTKEINAYNPSGTSTVTVSWVTEVELTNHYPNQQTGDVWVLGYLMLFPGAIPTALTFADPTVQVLAWKYE